MVGSNLVSRTRPVRGVTNVNRPSTTTTTMDRQQMCTGNPAGALSIMQLLQEKPFARPARTSTSVRYFTERKVIKSANHSGSIGPGFKLDLSKVKRDNEPIRVSYFSRTHRPLSAQLPQTPKEKPVRVTSARILRSLKEDNDATATARQRGNFDKNRHCKPEWIENHHTWNCKTKAERFQRSSDWTLHDETPTRPTPPWCTRRHLGNVRMIQTHTARIQKHIDEQNEKHRRIQESRLKRKQENILIGPPSVIKTSQKRYVPAPQSILPKTSLYQASPRLIS
mmetsp:Transcript_30621/g.49075  ORF Transcript_30621/g.49075 Transcript_30621/m.49075 type:complete len:281 (-) Transcript_30621:4653-5495(-)